MDPKSILDEMAYFGLPVDEKLAKSIVHLDSNLEVLKCGTSRFREWFRKSCTARQAQLIKVRDEANRLQVTQRLVQNVLDHVIRDVSPSANLNNAFTAESITLHCPRSMKTLMSQQRLSARDKLP